VSVTHYFASYVVFRIPASTTLIKFLKVIALSHNVMWMQEFVEITMEITFSGFDMAWRYLLFLWLDSSYLAVHLGWPVSEYTKLTHAKICRIHRFKSVGLCSSQEECPLLLKNSVPPVKQSVKV